MSVVDKRGVKEEVGPRAGADVVWQQLLTKLTNDPRSLRRDLARRHHDNRLIWKYLAMFALRESGWSLVEIGRAFNTHKGHVLRCIANMKQRIRDGLHIDPELSLRATPDPDLEEIPEEIPNHLARNP